MRPHRPLLAALVSTSVVSAGAVGAFAQSTASASGVTSAAASGFDVLNFAVVGNSLLSEAEIGEAVYPFLGENKNADAVEAARQALEKAYQDKGYQTVTVSLVSGAAPAGGSVTLSVTEIKVGRLRVVGSNYTSLDQVRSEAPSLKEGEVPNFNALNKDVVTLNSLPYRQVTPALKPGRAPNTVDVDLQVDDRFPISAQLELNNNYSVNTAQERLIAGASYDNLFQLGHSIGATYITAPQNTANTQVFSTFYTARFPGEPFSITATGITSDSNTFAAGTSGVLGNGYQIGLALNWTLPAWGALLSTVGFGADYKAYDQTVAPAPAAPVTYVPIFFTYLGSYKERTATDTLDLTITHGLASVSDPRFPNFDAQRFNARGGFTKLTGRISRDQQLPYGLSVFLQLDGQVTDQPLITTETFALGGNESVRGYVASEALADNALRGSYELRSMNLADGLVPQLNSVQLVGFVDGAIGSILDPLPEQPTGFGLFGAGFGTRLRLLDRVNVALDLAWALNNSDTTRAGDVRGLFRVFTAFP